MDHLISSVIGYVLGSFPTAYVLLKKKGIDITKVGSGNVGAMNSYEVTNSKVIGITVLLIDFLKGFLSVLIVGFFYPESFALQGIALIFAIFSHCFNPWINFNGGRGLATAAGGVILLLYPLLIIWLLLWIITYLMKKNIHFSNVSATILSLLIIFNNAELSLKYSSPNATNSETVVLIITMGLMIIFIKHIEPLKDLLKSFNHKGIKND
ncbi:MAG: glycerol-3-phosphate acyltransferase [Ignavibacterium sp.]|nr:glycerol-3-phosphate acyltransferase [Ignavibacterium sp.]MDW8374070.1 glycerol-3-phosphate acyltransferase [Ignavibacteriales bacterium]